jgi:hypothetical protein
MTTALFLSYLEEIPALRAEQLLDLSSASHPTENWFQAQLGVLRAREYARSGALPEEASGPPPPTPFRLRLADPQGTGSFVGLVSPRFLQRRVRELQDGGYS